MDASSGGSGTRSAWSTSGTPMSVRGAGGGLFPGVTVPRWGNILRGVLFVTRFREGVAHDFEHLGPVPGDIEEDAEPDQGPRSHQIGPQVKRRVWDGGDQAVYKQGHPRRGG